MNIKAMRNIHLYLGVFFAPLLVFFLLTGCLQTFGLHEPNKTSNYAPPAIVKSLAQVHKDQKWSVGRTSKSSMPFRYLIILMVLGLFVTTILGVVMAFKYTRPWIVWTLLFFGILVPSLFIWIVTQ